MSDRKEVGQEQFLFCTTVEAQGLQVRSMLGAAPQCVALE